MEKLDHLMCSLFNKKGTFFTQKSWSLCMWHKNRMKEKWKNSPCIQINRAELSIVFFKWRNHRKGNGKSCSPLAWTNSFFMVLNLLVLSWQFLFELWIKSFFLRILIAFCYLTLHQKSFFYKSELLFRMAYNIKSIQ